VQNADVWVIQRRDRARLPLESFRRLILGYFDSDNSVQPSIAGLVHFAHPTGADGLEDFVGAEPRSDHERWMLRNRYGL